MGDVNVKPNDIITKNVCHIYGCKNIAKDKTYFKKPVNPTSLDLIITTRSKSFQEHFQVSFQGNRFWVNGFS